MNMQARLDVRGMEANLYKAAINGSFEEVCRISNWKEQRTPTNNNILHIHVGKPLEKEGNLKSSSGWDQMVYTGFIETVLDSDQEGYLLLLNENSSGDTPLHLAARFGHGNVVGVFLERANRVSQDKMKELLKVTNKKGDTALHEAARFGHDQAVTLLVEADPDGSCHQHNVDRETPLYLAAERGSSPSVSSILQACTASTLAYNGPCGRTALHAAVQSGDPEMVTRMLDKDKSLMRIQNDEGLTPLHFAAAESHNLGILKILVEYDSTIKSSVVYIQDKMGRTALHIAVLGQNWRGMWWLIESCPDSMEIVDCKGQNVLHYAVKWAHTDVVKGLLKSRPIIKLFNDKDVEGNTPLHILALSIPHSPYLTCNPLHNLPDVVKNNPYLDLEAYNKQNLTFGDILHSSDSLLRSQGILEGHKFPKGTRINKNERDNDIESAVMSLGEWDVEVIKKAAESRLVVAALIATISFTAGFTVPGGFDQNPGSNMGMAVFKSKASFKVFLVSDVIAFTSSTLAILFYFVLVSTTTRLAILNLSLWALGLNTLSLGALMIAFLAGVYAVSSTSIGILIAISAAFCFFYVRLIVRNILLIKNNEVRTSFQERLTIFLKTL